ncbi:hypothetical protein ACHAXT_008646 [Thalassiosira profunda]
MPRANAAVDGRPARRRSHALIALVLFTFVAIGVVNVHLVARLERSLGIGIGAEGRPSPASPSRARPVRTTPSQRNGTDDQVLEYFRQAGVEPDDASLRRLPTWAQIEALIGGAPVVYGLDRCEDYRDAVPPLRRMLGVSGMFNSGTNLVRMHLHAMRLMKENCVIPERYQEWGPEATKEQWGIRWQVPWGKHTPAKFKYAHTAPKNENVTKDDCLPIVTVRNPYNWMRSMCKLPYTARWSMQERGKPGQGTLKICPHLVYTGSTSEKKAPVEVKAKLAEQWLTYDSLAHLWNQWYAEYWRDADFPFLIVRFEDLIFRQFDTTKILCNCAGGEVKSRSSFKYIVNSAKQGPGHGKKSERTGMVDAWVRYGTPPEPKAGFSDLDWEASLEFLSREFMEKMGYHYPPSE